MIGQRLRQLRLARGFSLEGLAAAAGGIVTKQAISKYEKCKAKPTPVVLNRVAAALGVKAAYLYMEPSTRIEFIAYRKGSGLLVKEQEKVESLVRQSLEERIKLQELIGQTNGTDLPIKSIAVSSIEDAENAAEDLRGKWNLGLDPISNVTDILEERLIHVFDIDAGKRFDGISAVAYDDHHVTAAAVVSRRGIPEERQRLNLGHELGHLVLDVPNSIDEEAVAFRFGAAFLAPAETLKHEVGGNRTSIRPDELLLMKRKYGMSAQALLYRMRDLKIIGESYYKQWCININKLGWRKQEPMDLQPERSSWLDKSVMRALSEELISKNLAEQFMGHSLENIEPLSLVERRAFMKLPLEEQRRIMAKQAERVATYYESDPEWRQFQGGDFIEY